MDLGHYAGRLFKSALRIGNTLVHVNRSKYTHFPPGRQTVIIAPALGNRKLPLVFYAAKSAHTVHVLKKVFIFKPRARCCIYAQKTQNLPFPNFKLFIFQLHVTLQQQ